MLEKLSGQIIDWQIKKGILTEEEHDIYQYAYELLINQIINVIIAVIIAIAFKEPMTVFLFLGSYIPLRSFCGGYHANTNFVCIVVSAFILCFVCLFTHYVQDKMMLIWYPVSFMVSGYFIIRFAPVPDRNKPLDEAETVRYRNKSRMLWGIETIIGILFCLKWRKYGMVIALSHIVMSIMLGLGKLKNRKTVPLSGNR